MVRPRPPQRERGDTRGRATPASPTLRARRREQRDGQDYDRVYGHRVTATLEIDPADYVEGLTGDLWIEGTTDASGVTGWERIVTSSGWAGGKKSSRHPTEDLMPSVSHWRSGSRDGAGQEYRRFRPGFSLDRRARVEVTIARDEVSELVDAHHSVAYENGDKNSALNTTSVSVTNFTTTGTDRVVYCRAGWNDTFPVSSLSSFTYGGTTLGSELGSSSRTGMEQALYRRIAPTTAASSIVASADAEQDSLAVFVAAYSGVHQTTPNRTPEAANGTGVNADDTITTDTDELIDSLLQTFGGTTTADGTSRLQETQSSDWNWHLQTVAPASTSQAVGFTGNSGEPYTMLSVSIQPSVATPTGTGVVTYPLAGLSGAGTQTHSASGAITYSIVAILGVGVMPPDASGAVTYPLVSVAGSGTHGAVTSGSGSITYPLATTAGAGGVAQRGTGAISYRVSTVVGAGIAPIAAAGPGAVAYPLVLVVGQGIGPGYVYGPVNDAEPALVVTPPPDPFAP